MLIHSVLFRIPRHQWPSNKNSTIGYRTISMPTSIVGSCALSVLFKLGLFDCPDFDSIVDSSRSCFNLANLSVKLKRASRNNSHEDLPSLVWLPSLVSSQGYGRVEPPSTGNAVIFPEPWKILRQFGILKLCKVPGRSKIRYDLVHITI